MFDVDDEETKACDGNGPGGVFLRLGLDDEPGWEVLGPRCLFFRCFVRAAG